jgi:type III restriction enzyme
LLLRSLQSNEQTTLEAETGQREERLENYIVFALADFEDVDYYSHAELLYDLATQVVEHLSYLTASEAHQVLSRDRRLIASELHAQMASHFWEEASGHEVVVSRGFTELKPCTYTLAPGQAIRNARETVEDLGRIKQMVFGGYQRCLYPLQKFDSGTEWRFSLLLDRETERWFKPVKGQFQIFYRLGTEQPEYVPDFVAETASAVLMVEIKARDELATPEVQEKSKAALQWCALASGHAAKVDSKPWLYLLIPHDEVTEAVSLQDLLRFRTKA